jgi:hypothetical protein
MAYKQYTQCTKKEDFSPLNRPLQIIGGIGGLLAMISSIILSAIGKALLSSAGAALWLAGATAGYLVIIATFKYLLGGKLICLGGDRFAVGIVVGIEPASCKPFPDNLDNDYSFNLLLLPYELKDATLPEKEKYEPANLPTINTSALAFQDQLVLEQEPSKFHGVPFTGYPNYPNISLLHCEIEGSRIYDTYQAFLAAWAVLVAAALAAMALGAIPVIGWLLAILAMLLGALIGGAIVAGTWLLADDGKVSDVEPELGNLENGNILFVCGTWTYDAGHNDEGTGWNELHPIKYIQKLDYLPTEEGKQKLEAAVLEAQTPQVRDNQLKDQNQWTIHPTIDGCQEDDENTPPVPIIK